MIPSDIYRVRSITEFAVSPADGRTAAVVSWLDEESDAEFSAVALLQTGELLRITAGRDRADSLRFSPDGRWLGYLSAPAGSVRNVWVLDLNDLAAPPRAATASPTPVIEFAWAPDGRSVAFTAKTVRPKRRSSAVVCTTMRYKSFVEGWLDDRKLQVWTSELFGAMRRVTNEDAEFSDVSFSPDGETLLCRSVRLRTDGRFGVHRLHLLPLDGGTGRTIFEETGAWFAPSFSPDGRAIAFIGSRGESADGSLTRRVFVLELADGAGPARDALGDWDYTAINSLLNETRPHTPIRPPRWSADGSRLYFVGTVRGAVDVYSVARAGGAPVALTRGDHEVVAFDVRGDRLTALITTPTEPGDLWAGWVGGTLERVTCINRHLEGELTFQPYEEVSYPSPVDGTPILAWVVKPPGFEPGRKYPLVTRIAGGPYLTYGHSFVDEVQTLASAGFVVLSTNPHGSQSFGQAFSSSVIGDWFGKDVDDVLAGVDHVLSLGYVDPQRLGLVGASYGGTLVNWIVAHDHRFGAAVAQRSLANLHSSFATTEWGWTNSLIFQFSGVNAYDDPMHYLKRSPVWYVNDIETPLLLLQSGNDTLTPVEQVEQIYVGLKLRGKLVELVIYPEEQHYVRRYGKPSNRVDYSERVIEWLVRFIGVKASTEAASAAAGTPRVAVATAG